MHGYVRSEQQCSQMSAPEPQEPALCLQEILGSRQACIFNENRRIVTWPVHAGKAAHSQRHLRSLAPSLLSRAVPRHLRGLLACLRAVQRAPRDPRAPAPRALRAPPLASSATRPWRVRASKIMAPMLPTNDGDAQVGSSTPLAPTRRVRRTGCSSSSKKNSPLLASKPRFFGSRRDVKRFLSETAAPMKSSIDSA